VEVHVFAVWDFMLIEGVAAGITCVAVPWKPSRYPHAMVRLRNEIVLGEESDLDADGVPTSIFALYLRAMREVGADTRPIEAFLSRYCDTRRIPEGPRAFVEFTLDTAARRTPVEVAAAFFFGRERLIQRDVRDHRGDAASRGRGGSDLPSRSAHRSRCGKTTGRSPRSASTPSAAARRR
jgi:hypothetical protein